MAVVIIDPIPNSPGAKIMEALTSRAANGTGASGSERARRTRGPRGVKP